MKPSPAELAAAIDRGKRLKLSDVDIALQLGVSVEQVCGEPQPKPNPTAATKPRKQTWHEPTEAELDELIESRRPTMPKS